MRALAVATVLVAYASAAHADDRATKLFEDGRVLLANGRDADACAKFTAAITLDPSAAGVMLNLGLCHERLGHFGTALRWFRKAQATAAESNLPEYEQAAKDHTLQLAAKVATIRIVPTAPPADLAIDVDGQAIPIAELGRVEVDPGHHELTARAAHRVTLHRGFDVVERGGNVIAIELAPGEDVAVEDPGAFRRHVAAGVAIGGGLIAIGSGVLAAYERFGPYADAKRRFDMGTVSAAADADHASHIVHVWGTTLFAVGIGGIAIAAAVYFTAPDKREVRRTAVVPVLAPDRAGLAFATDF